MRTPFASSSTATTRGYTLLFAVLTAVLVLSVTVFIVSVSRKQYILASAARESTYSIYAAYSGMECAAKAYIAGTLATSTGGVAQDASISCAGTTATGNWSPLDSGANVGLETGDVSDTMLIPFSNGCVQVTVYVGEDAEGTHKTIIDSRGYNLCSGGGDPQIGPRTVERAFRLTYE